MNPSTTPQIIVLKELSGNPPVQLHPIQQFMAPHIDTMVAFWIAVWFATGIAVLLGLLRDYREHRKSKH
jgi:hypothetical protein